MKPHLIDDAPELLYPDRGCPSWPTCLECPFDPCVDTSDQAQPSRVEHRVALMRARVVVCYQDGLSTRAIANTLGIGNGVVERGLRRYREDVERARRKSE